MPGWQLRTRIFADFICTVPQQITCENYLYNNKSRVKLYVISFHTQVEAVKLSSVQNICYVFLHTHSTLQPNIGSSFHACKRCNTGINVCVFLDSSIQYNHMYVLWQFINHICIYGVYIPTPVCLGRKQTKYMKVLHKVPSICILCRHLLYQHLRICLLSLCDRHKMDSVSQFSLASK